MSEFRGFKSIHEIFADRDKRYEQELNAYLAAGWVIVDIHQRSYRDPHINDEVKVSVYIMGHSDANVLPPKWGDTTAPT